MEIKCTFLGSDGVSAVAGPEPGVPLADPNATNLPLAVAPMEIGLATGQIVIVTGPNGVGKSALLGEIARCIETNAGQDQAVETFFGNRHIQFESSEVDEIGADLQRFQQQLRNVTRYSHPWGERHLKSVVRRIINKQGQATNDQLRMIESGATIADAAAAHPEPIRTINGIFNLAGIPIQFALNEGRLRARRDRGEYGIERLSDGERAALLITGAVLIRPRHSFIVLDEPERHLNPAISGALLSALTRARSDVGYIFATHDIHLIEWLVPDKIIHVRDSFLVVEQPEQRRFDLAILKGDDALPEDLRYAILGSRRRLLLVEGTTTSEDRSLYGHIYFGWNIVSREGWETVSNEVRALAENDDYHWLTVAGLIDADGRDENEKAALAAHQVSSLPVPSIENLFLHPVALDKMGDAAHSLHGGAAGPERVAAVESQLVALLTSSKNDIIARRLVWEANRLISAQKPSVKSLREGQTEISKIDLEPIRQRLEAEFEAVLQDGDTQTMLSNIALKNTPIPGRIAKLIGYSSFKDYKRATLKQIESGSEAGVAILEALRQKMPSLPQA